MEPNEKDLQGKKSPDQENAKSNPDTLKNIAAQLKNRRNSATPNPNEQTPVSGSPIRISPPKGPRELEQPWILRNLWKVAILVVAVLVVFLARV